jgi:hypothetical protein
VEEPVDAPEQPFTGDPEELFPINSFSHFFGADVLQRITEHTNVFASMKGAQKTSALPGEGRSWDQMTSNELRVWLGSTIIMGITKEPSLQDYWRPKDGTNSYHPFTDFMSLCRYQQIKRYLHISLPLRSDLLEEPGYNPALHHPETWARKVDWLLEHIRARTRSLGKSEGEPQIDEAITLRVNRIVHEYFTKNGGSLVEFNPKAQPPPGERHSLVIPDHKGSVERANQIRPEYTTQQKSSRNWLPLFWYLLDTALSISYISFKVCFCPPRMEIPKIRPS